MNFILGIIIACSLNTATVDHSHDDRNTVTSSTSGSRDRTPPCKYEDGSGQGGRCVWDARHMGNGAGRSLVIINGGEDNAVYRFVSHKRAHWLFRTSN